MKCTNDPLKTWFFNFIELILEDLEDDYKKEQEQTILHLIQ